MRMIGSLLDFIRDIRKPPVLVWNPDGLQKRIGHIALFTEWPYGQKRWRRWEMMD